MVKSWKTTLAGVVAILTAVLAAVSQYLSGGFAAVRWEVLIAAVTAGIGLIAAKDSDVTGAGATAQRPGV